ncbi:MAG: hypothetical protein ABI665_09345 [Vicinamibacterales bacterium]
MQPSDKPAFLKALVTLSELFGKPLSPAVQVLYFDALVDVDAAALRRAMNTAAQTCTFMPKPAELRTLAIGNTEDQAEMAWVAMRAALSTVGAYRSLVTADAALGETMLAMFGSWPTACASDFSAEMWAAKRKEFGRIYRVMKNRDLPGARYLPGLIERHNAGRDEWAKYTEIGLVSPDGAVRCLNAMEAEEARTLLAAQAGEPTRINQLLAGVSLKAMDRPESA